MSNETKGPQPPAEAQRCTCPSGDGSLRWPCPAHPPEAQPVAKLVVEKDGLVKFIRPTGLGLDLPAGEYLLHLHPSPAEAQPVAWRFQHQGEWRYTETPQREVEKAHGFEPAQALYTAPPSAPVGVPVDVVREYLDARACYDAATRPPNSHARAPVLKHDDPDALRLREARVALDNAIALAQQPAAVDGDWRKKAAEWLESKAVEQEAANQKWPSHAACYKEWRDRPGILRHLAFQVLAGQHGGES